MSTLRPLTPKQRAFAENMLAGLTGAEAYRQAYRSRMTASATTVEAARTAKLPHVAAYIAAKREAQTKKAEATGEMSREFLLSQLRKIIEASKPADRIRAIAQASRMLGYDAPQKVEGVPGGQPIIVKWMS
jgi:phage terminase small subunit